MTRRGIGLVAALVALAAACGPTLPPPPPERGSMPANSPTLTVNPSFVTQTDTGAPNGVVTIDHPWDLAFVDATRALFTERLGRISLFDSTVGGPAKLIGTVGNLHVNGESGLMGIAADPNFAANQFIYVCVSANTPNGKFNQIRRYTVNLDLPPGLGLSGEVVLLNEMTAVSVFDIHNGCRLRFQPETNPPALFITVGDGGVPTGPQDRRTLYGKILRVNVDGGVLGWYPGNPFEASYWFRERLLYTYGHRNPQGLAFRPFTNAAFTSEHGPDINDEVNRLCPGCNAGWDPNLNTGKYEQSVPMTDLRKFPGAIRPSWRSGDGGTLAPSGMTFLSGPQWGSWNGALAVAFLKNRRVRIMWINQTGGVSETWAPPEIIGLNKRLRVAVQGPDGNLYLTTDERNADNDAIVQVVPTPPS